VSNADLSVLEPNWVQQTEVTIAGGKSLPQSWYPLLKSKQLKKGQIKLIELFNKQWILFRTQSGDPVVCSRYCCHMGVDLLCGKVVNNNLICPMHRWEFNNQGHCIKMPSDEPIPKSAKQSTLPCHERFGVIFVFWGNKALFEIPSFPGLIDPMIDKPHFQTAPTPFVSIMLNAFDIHHLKYVHSREVIEKPIISSYNNNHLAIDLTTRVLLNRWTDYLTRMLGFKIAHIRFDCWGGNLIMVTNKSARFRVLLALAPISETHCNVFFIGAMEKHNLNLLKRVLRRMRLIGTCFLGKEFLRLDIPMFTGMQPKAGTLLKEADACAVRFWQHWKRLPRKDITEYKEDLS